MQDPVLSQPPLPRPAPKVGSKDAPSGTIEDTVAEFLRLNPGFLATHPELYRGMIPPQRVHGDAMADHMAAMLRAEREHAEAMTARAASVLAAGRAAAGLTARVHEAVLALLRTGRNAGDVAEFVASELSTLLGMDAASLCIEDLRIEGRRHEFVRTLPSGTVERLLGGKMVVFRTAAADARLLHGEAAGLAITDALIRVPGNGTACLLALVARDDTTLDPAQGAGALSFLGRAVAASLGR